MSSNLGDFPPLSNDSINYINLECAPLRDHPFKLAKRKESSIFVFVNSIRFPSPSSIKPHESKARYPLGMPENESFRKGLVNPLPLNLNSIKFAFSAKIIISLISIPFDRFHITSGSLLFSLSAKRKFLFAILIKIISIFQQPKQSCDGKTRWQQ